MPNEKAIKAFKSLWIRCAKDPVLFSYTFLRDKKNRPLNPHTIPAQEEVVKAYATGAFTEIYMSGGNSAGKSALLEMLASFGAFYKFNPQSSDPYTSYDDFMKRPYGVLITGAEQKHSNEVWEGVLDMIRRSPALAGQVKKSVTSGRLHPHPRITLTNGTFIDSIGLHEKGKHVVTGDYSLVLVNEIAEVRELKYIMENVLTQRTWRRGGIIVGSGTPRGKSGEYWDIFKRGLPQLPGTDTPNPAYNAQVFSTFGDSRDNPFASQDKIALFVGSQNDRIIEERVKGYFTDVEGAAFSMLHLNNIFTPKLPFESKRSGRMQIVHGVDFGRKGDYTVCITLDISKKPWRGIHFYRKGGGYGTWEEIFNDIKSIYHDYGGEFTADTTASSGDIQSEWLTELEIPFIPMNFSASPARKVNLINLLQRVVEKEEIKLPDEWDQLKSEMRNYPANLDDKTIVTDSVIAMALAAYGAEYFGVTEPPTPIKM